MSAAALDHLARALEATGALIAGIGDEQWAYPTPCPEWNVRALLNHVVVGNHLVARLVQDDPSHPAEQLRQMRDLDHLGDDPLAAYRASGVAVQDAFSAPGALERIVEAPIGAVPGAVLMHLRIIDLLVHGWDLARATGQSPNLPDDLAAEELAFASGPQAPAVPRTGHPFGPVQSVADTAPPIDRLAAYLGRPVTPAAPASDHA